MANNFCPVCGQPIETADINIKEGVALCRACGALSPLSAVVNQPAPNPMASAAPPRGCACDEYPGGGLDVRAANRAVGPTLFFLVFSLFWNGVLSIFLIIALSGVYRHFVGPLPAWAPVPRDARNDSWGEALFLCIFLVPFVAVGIVMILVFLTSLLGRVRVVVSGDEGRVRVGVGPFNFSRRFNAAAVTRVAAAQSGYVMNNQTTPTIQIDADRTIRFGSLLSSVRRAWMIDVLRTLLVLRRGARAPAKAAALSRR